MSRSLSRNSYNKNRRDDERNGGDQQSSSYSRNAYSRNVASAGYAAEMRKTRNRKRILIGVVVALLAALVACAALAVTYLNRIQDNISENVTDDTLSVLDTAEPGDPFYILLMGVDGSEERANSEQYAGDTFRSDSMILARVDPGLKTVTMISLHRDTLVDMGAYGTQKLNAAHAIGGAALAIEVVSDFAGVPIAHFAEINFDGFEAMVDALGGIEVDVPLEINDWRAGGHVDAGLQTLNGEEALILCRSRHTYDAYGDGDRYRAANQRMVLGAIMDKVLSSDPVTIAATVEALSEYATTDMSVLDIVSLATSMIGMDVENNFYSAMEPTTAAYVNETWYEYVNESEWRTMMERVDAGLPPYEETIIDPATGMVMADAGDGGETEEEESSESAGPVQRSGYVSVKNGMGEAGVGEEVVELVKALGYSAESSNANHFDYQHTVVVYENAGQKKMAEEIVDAIGAGFALQNDGSYIYEGDFLVLIGADWLD